MILPAIPKQLKPAVKLLATLLKREPCIQTFGVINGLSFLGFVPYPLPTFVAGSHANTESLTQFPSCINSTVFWGFVYLRYVKSANDDDKKHTLHIVIFFLMVCNLRAGETEEGRQITGMKRKRWYLFWR